MCSIQKFIFFLLATTSTLLLAIAAQHNDFKFDEKTDDVFYVEPTESDEISNSNNSQTKTAQCSQDVVKCSDNSNKIMLSLLMLNYNWDEIITVKADRAVNKLAKFCKVHEGIIVRNNANDRDIKEMQKFALLQGDNFNKKGESCGRIEFPIGCDKDVFPACQSIVDNLPQQIRENTISDVTGLTIDGFAVWTKRRTNRVPRREKRDAEPEGSGEDDYYDYDEENSATPKPGKGASEHAHRHHHGDDNLDHVSVDSNKDTDFVQTLDRNIIDSAKVDDNSNIQEGVNQLELEIKKTIENNNEKVKEVQRELEEIMNEKKEASSKILMGEPLREVEQVLLSTTITSTVASTTLARANDGDDKIEDPILLAPKIVEDNIVGTTEFETTVMTTSPKVDITAKIDLNENVGNNLEGSRIDDVTLIPFTTKMEADKTSTSEKIVPESRNVAATSETVADFGNYDEAEYDDYDDKAAPTVRGASGTTTSRAETTTPITTNPTTTPANLPTTSTERITTTEIADSEVFNNPPVIKSRLAKLPVTSGKPFSQIVPQETFFDVEDGFNMRLELLDKHDKPLDAKSWIQFNSDKREIYGLPLEDAVSKWQFKLKATDNANDSITEHLDISVQQHKSYRSVNHEIAIGIKLNRKYDRIIDWQLQLIQGIVSALGDNSLSSILVRDVRYSISDSNVATFIYTNETLPKDKCPGDKLDELFQRLTVESLAEVVGPEITIKSVHGKPIGPCSISDVIKSSVPKPTQQMSKNYPPVPRNQVDRVNATVGHLLVYKVPLDTFYDPEDNTDLNLRLLTSDRQELDPKHWLQFDSKNREFYGIPKFGDAGQNEYVLVAEDREGLSASDALVVVVGNPPHREYNMLFEIHLGMAYEEFNSSAVQRRFIDRLLQIFNDPQISNIQIRAIRKVHSSGKTHISFYNTTLHRPHHVCPSEQIEALRNILTYPHDGKVRPQVNEIIGTEFEVTRVNFMPVGACSKHGDIYHAVVPIKPDDTKGATFKDEYLLTFALPAIIIVAMLLLACITACILHRRRMSGKMELGDEEERRSFRSKGIPVIFQDELDEKPEIGNKSPVILKDEKPPLLPPTYNTANPNDHEDMDEYIPPPAVVVSGKESRGKSPVMPSYRKPPPYVSP